MLASLKGNGHCIQTLARSQSGRNVNISSHSMNIDHNFVHQTNILAVDLVIMLFTSCLRSWSVTNLVNSKNSTTQQRKEKAPADVWALHDYHKTCIFSCATWGPLGVSVRKHKSAQICTAPVLALLHWNTICSEGLGSLLPPPHLQPFIKKKPSPIKYRAWTVDGIKPLMLTICYSKSWSVCFVLGTSGQPVPWSPAKPKTRSIQHSLSMALSNNSNTHKRCLWGRPYISIS